MSNSKAGILFALLATLLRAGEPDALLAQAQAAYEAKDYARCAELYAGAVQAGARDRATPYNAACCYALDGKRDEAFVWLGNAIDAGGPDVAHWKRDSDLELLRADERWAPTIKRAEEAAAAFAKEPALREELLKRMKEDQRIRMTPNSDHAEWMRIDADNSAFMRTVIEKHGWPGKSLVGDDGALAAFLMVQHAYQDHEFQKKCLKLITAAVEAKEASPRHMALLHDRVLMFEGKPQIYGSQFRTVDGKLEPYLIEDEANLDARRASVGLEPMAEYTKQMEGSYGNGPVQSVKEPALREELLKHVEKDLHFAKNPNADMAEWTKVAADNTVYMKTVIEKHGWPGKSVVGEDGADAAFLMVHHASADPAFQKKCLELLTKAVEDKEASADDLAYLTDRVLVAEGKPQRYGTQLDTAGGKLQPLPVEDEANLDARRKAVGLPPMAEYLKQHKAFHGGKP